MDKEKICELLSRNAWTLKELLTGLTEIEYCWKPLPEKWCLLEVICHLYDEEREDFRMRTQHILDTPEVPLKPIDPPVWVLQRAYMEQDYAARLNEFLEERSRSITWMRSVKDVNWDNSIQHSSLGTITARLVATNWVAHDYLHIRQITRLKYQYLEHITKESLTYAGKW